MIARLLIPAVLGLAALGGCVGTKPTPTTIGQNVDKLLSAGNTNGAIAILSSASANRDLAQARPAFFRHLLFLLLESGRTRAAEARCLAALRDDPLLAGPGFDIVTRYYDERKDWGGLTNWTVRVLNARIAPVFREPAYTVYFLACRQQGAFATIEALAPACLATCDPDAARRALERLAITEVDAFQYAEAGRLLDLVAAHTTQPVLASFVALHRANICLRTNDWAAVEAVFAEPKSALTDADLRSLLNAALEAASSKDRKDLADRLCLAVLEKHVDKANAHRFAAEQWLRPATVPPSPADAVRRMEKLLAMGGIPPDIYHQFLTQNFYPLASAAKPEELVALSATVAKVAPLLNEQDRTDVRLMMLDGAFIANDYDRAIRLLEEGVPGKEKDWIDMSIAKLQGHKALAEGRKKDAVDAFRRFMALLPKVLKQPETDPTTGILYTVDMCLGRNARRIGDILKSAGEMAAAQQSYEESRQYWKKALSDAAPDSDAAKLIQAELKALESP